jgi:hypothetical protein
MWASQFNVDTSCGFDTDFENERPPSFNMYTAKINQGYTIEDMVQIQSRNNYIRV